jgi:hypothetical protein
LQTASAPKRKKIFVSHGFQWRFAALVAGSLTVLLLFTGLHGLFVAQLVLPEDVAQQVRPVLAQSTIRVFLVGAVYIAVVTLAAVFLSHRTVGPLGRLEEDLNHLAESPDEPEPIKVREGDGLEGLVSAVNRLMERLKG